MGNPQLSRRPDGSSHSSDWKHLKLVTLPRVLEATNKSHSAQKPSETLDLIFKPIKTPNVP